MTALDDRDALADPKSVTPTEGLTWRMSGKPVELLRWVGQDDRNPLGERADEEREQ